MTEAVRLTEHATEADHAGVGASELARQFADKPRVAALLAALLAGVQLCETETWELYALTINSSSAHALDQIGAVLLQPRPDGLSDANYRKVLRGVVLALRSSGTGDEMEAVARAVLGAWATITEAFPATLVVTPAEDNPIPTTVILSVLRRAKSAGVGLQVIDMGPDPRFRFSSSAEEAVVNSDHGFGDSTGAVSGGELVGVVV